MGGVVARREVAPSLARLFLRCYVPFWLHPCQQEVAGCGLGVLADAVRTRRWGRGPAGRGLTGVTYQGLRLDPLKDKSHKWCVGDKKLIKRKWDVGK